MSTIQTPDDLIAAMRSGVQVKYYSPALNEFGSDGYYLIGDEVVDTEHPLFGMIVNAFEEADIGGGHFRVDDVGRCWQHLVLAE